MTVIQKQALLLYLGYYVGKIDGIWGALSKTATRAFQQDHGLKDDGIFGAATEKKILAVIASSEAPKTQPTPTPTPTADDWDDIEFFSKKEFRCKCGGRYCNGYPAEIDLTMVRYADEIRRRIGKPIGVNSGLRCSQWNQIQGGASSSQHMYGTAADLGKPSGVSVAEMVAIAEDVMGNTGGIGIYSWGIHIDSRKTKSRWNG
jgi:peptidoglycan hydrolase-like protein with peptidoglycan-binding domain